ncbi:iron-containing redox enzyme family protein [Corallococcus exercitus]|uniref:Iron-containing redox enzyme family protein n=1 Tax=Corallococcus exercitus TaxID=2316736 RepID=A0A3A8HX41_9BACT|nr:iron-containing redox enzyme family protein [Corallococcus exercitus]NOK35508.1 iron-containing redox enzyme family protein [Corallococcus exercitus]RKG75687.1 iron-containing redox enzyme family protein [Corallococcus exercitus]
MSGLGEVAGEAGTEDARLSERLHRTLLRFNRARLAPGFPTEGWRAAVQEETQLRLLEGEYVEAERQRVAAWAAEAPEDADGFIAWFEDLKESGPGQHDPLFPWLATQATREQMNWFLTQEVAGEAGFDDLVALTQLQLPTQAKLELARNYWDEMGRGREDAMHGPMLAEMAAKLGLKPTDEDTVWEAHALANLLCAFAFNRRYTFHAVGALGIVEETAPGRTACVNEGLKRLGFDMRVRRYYALHSTLDVKHSETWNKEVLRPLVAANPACARPLAEGALLRLTAGARCFERYRHELGLDLKSIS